MRTTLDLPDAVLRSLKIQAAQSGKSLKALLNELIVRAMTMPAAPATSQKLVLPVLRRLKSSRNAQAEPATLLSHTDLTDAQLQGDLDKLRRSGFVQ